jgi:hypothetical protein
VARIIANDEYHAPATYNFAVIAQSFDASTYFHGSLCSLFFAQGPKAHQYMVWHGICSRARKQNFPATSQISETPRKPVDYVADVAAAAPAVSPH